MIQEVTTYVLEMSEISQFKPKEGYKERLQIKKMGNDVFQHWMMFVGVGLPWRWYSRLEWSMEEWRNYLESGTSNAYMVFSQEELIGYFELVIKNKKVELKFLGLLPHYIRKGYGSDLISYAIAQAWKLGGETVWLHTCTSDHKAALEGYLKQGFKLINESSEAEDIPDKEEYLKMFGKFLDEYFNYN